MNGLPYIYALTYKGVISYVGLHNGCDKYYFSSGVIPKKMGKDRFIKGVIEYCTLDDLIEKEVYYIDLYKPRFNLTSGGELHDANTKHSIETIQKRRESFLKNVIYIEKLRNRISELNKLNNPCIKHAIKCITDGETFESIREASRYYQIDNSFLAKHLKGQYKSVKNLQFIKL